MQHSIGKLITVVLLLFLLSTTLFSHATASETSANAPVVHLQSRTFTPQPGVDNRLQSRQPAGRWHGLIQFETMPDEAQRLALEEAGVELLTYIPENSWLASLPADWARVTSQPGIRWIGPYLPADRLAPALADGNHAPWATRPNGDMALTVDIFPDIDLAAAAAAVNAAGGTVVETVPALSQLHIILPANELWSLAAVDSVQWIAPGEPPKSTNNDLVRSAVYADPVLAAPYGLTGQGVQAAMWDDGHVDAGHPDFAGRLTRIGDYSVKNHATHVAGTMGGNGANSVNQGGAPGEWQGIAPGASIFSYNWSNVINAHDQAINTYGADLSQNSWGYSMCGITGQYDYNAPQYDSIITGLWGRGIPVIFAAGNTRSSCGSYGTVQGGPPSAKNVITVGAVNGDNDQMTSFSAWGPTLDGRLKPELVAPGRVSTGAAIWSTLPGGGYGGYTGTSMAAPAVSGSVALLLERFQDVCPGSGDSNGNPLPSTTRALLIHGADDLNDGGAMQRGPDYASGYGRLNIQRAIDILPYHLEGSLGHGGEMATTVFVARQSSLKVTLTWDDVPAAAAASVTLINDLDLELVDPNGNVFHPWVLDPANPSAAATTGVDRRNVVEQVVVDNPVPGTWTIRVKGTNIPQGPQAYSLVSNALTESSCQGPGTEVWLDDNNGTSTASNDTSSSLWESYDVWVRHEPDPNLLYAHQHQNPEHGQTNYLYVKVRNDGQQIAHTVQVLAYWGDQGTAPAVWSADWESIGSSTAINIAPNGDQVIMVPWNPPAPASRYNGQVYSLYVRLVSTQDPFVEGTNASANVSNNDDIAGKDVLVVDYYANGDEVPTAVSLSAIQIVPTLSLGPLYGAAFILLTLATLFSRLVIRQRRLY